MLPHLLWRISKGLGSNIIPEAAFPLTIGWGDIAWVFFIPRELKTDFLGTSHGSAVEGRNFRGRAHARGVPLARSI